MMNNIDKELQSIKQDILKLKTGQATQGDSSNYYSVKYEPGWYISDNNHWREHTIKCVPYTNKEKAIFMPVLCPSEWYISGGNAVGRLLTYGQEYITWAQNGYTQSQLSNASFAMGVPKGFMIFSNVDFYIETSYVDKSL